MISIDGTTGEVYHGAIPTVEPNFGRRTTCGHCSAGPTSTASWASGPTPTIRATPQRAVTFGAEGIGLCRTEHMFMEQERLPIVQEMILAPTNEERQEALDQLLPFQRGDFEGIFRAMRDPKTGEGYPVVIRLIDPPLHEFLPSYEELLVEVTRLEDGKGNKKELAEKRKLLAAVAAMRETNPMLGLRGCRLGLLFPEINIMQTRAILEAARNVAKDGIKLQPEDHDPAGGPCQRATRGAPPARSGGQGDRGRERRAGGLQVRHDDRAATRRADRRADRASGRVLQLRHQRPDADDLRHEPRRRRGQVPAASTSRVWKSLDWTSR